MSNIEKAMGWAVQIGQGTGENPSVTEARARSLADLMANWDAEVLEKKKKGPYFVEVHRGGYGKWIGP